MPHTRELFVNIETSSPLNLAKSKVYSYADHDDFELVQCGYSIDGGPIEIIDLVDNHELPGTVVVNPCVTK